VEGFNRAPSCSGKLGGERAAFGGPVDRWESKQWICGWTCGWVVGLKATGASSGCLGFSSTG